MWPMAYKRKGSRTQGPASQHDPPAPVLCPGQRQQQVHLTHSVKKHLMRPFLWHASMCSITPDVCYLADCMQERIKVRSRGRRERRASSLLPTGPCHVHASEGHPRSMVWSSARSFRNSMLSAHSGAMRLWVTDSCNQMLLKALTRRRPVDS